MKKLSSTIWFIAAFAVLLGVFFGCDSVDVDPEEFTEDVNSRRPDVMFAFPSGEGRANPGEPFTFTLAEVVAPGTENADQLRVISIESVSPQGTATATSSGDGIVYNPGSGAPDVDRTVTIEFVYSVEQGGPANKESIALTLNAPPRAATDTVPVAGKLDKGTCTDIPFSDLTTGFEDPSGGPGIDSTSVRVVDPGTPDTGEVVRTDTASATVKFCFGTTGKNADLLGTGSFTYTVKDLDGAESNPRTAIVSTNEGPTGVDPDAERLAVGDPSLKKDLRKIFDDPDGDTLTYEAQSDDESVATVRVDNNILSVTPEGPGQATITATAMDSTLANSVEFTVRVIRRPQVNFVRTGSRVNEGAEFEDLELTISPPPTQDIEVVVSYDRGNNGGNPDDINDFSEKTVTFPKESTERKLIRIMITDDPFPETEEEEVVLKARVAEGNNAVVGDNDTYTLTILDNDRRPVVQFAEFRGLATEGGDPFDLKVVIDKAPAEPVTVAIIYEPDEDIGTVIPESVTFPVGSSDQQIVKVPIFDDSDPEDPEIIEFDLTVTSDNADLGSRRPFELTIADNERIAAEVDFSETERTVQEDDGGSISVTVTLSEAQTADVTVDVEFTGGTGTVDDIDNFETQTLIFPAEGNRVQSFDISLNNDNDQDCAQINNNQVCTETFEFSLTSIEGNAVTGDASTFILTIEDNDFPRLEFVKADGEAAEGDDFEIEVEIFNYALGTITGTARLVEAESEGDTLDIDMVIPARFEAGDGGRRVITIPILRDGQQEGEEELVFELKLKTDPGVNAVVGDKRIFRLTIESSNTSSRGRSPPRGNNR